MSDCGCSGEINLHDGVSRRYLSNPYSGMRSKVMKLLRRFWQAGRRESNSFCCIHVVIWRVALSRYRNESHAVECSDRLTPSAPIHGAVPCAPVPHTLPNCHVCRDWMLRTTLGMMSSLTGRLCMTGMFRAFWGGGDPRVNARRLVI